MKYHYTMIILVFLFLLQGAGASEQYGEEVTVAFIADTGHDYYLGLAMAVVNNSDYNVSLIVHAGDMRPEATYAYADDFFDKVETHLAGNQIPIIATIGNHDYNSTEGYGIWYNYSARLLERIDASGQNIICTGVFGLNSTCIYNGIRFEMMAPGWLGSAAGEDFQVTQAIENSLSTATENWRVCSSHLTQNSLQTYNKVDESGWDFINTCTKYGAIIQQGHSHLYSRTYSMDNLETKSGIRYNITHPQVDYNHTFQFINSIDSRAGNQIETWDWMAKTINETLTVAPLICTFNYQNDVSQAYCRLISGHPDNSADPVLDEYWITNLYAIPQVNWTLKDHTGLNDDIELLDSAFDNGIIFNGTSHARINTSAYLDIGAPMTIEMNITPQNIALQRILHKYVSSGNSYQISMISDGRIGAVWRRDGTLYRNTANNVTMVVNQTYHVVATIASDNTIRIWIDGEEQSLTTSSLVDGGTETYLFLGQRSDGTSRFTGTIHNFRIYDTELTGFEAERLYDGYDVACDDLNAWYAMESEQQVCEDISILNNYEGASIGDYTISLDNSFMNFSLITDAKNYTYWTDFILRGANGLNYSFRIENADQIGFLAREDGNNTIFYTCDNTTHNRITDRSYNSGKYNFNISIPESCSHMRITTFYPYTFSDLESYLYSIATDERASLTSIYNMTGIGKVYELTISGGSQNIVILSRQHPAEIGASYQLEGFLNYILGGSSNANSILEDYTFKVYPMISINGTYHGMSRTDMPNDDTNRLWHADDNTHYVVPTIRSRIESLGSVYLMIDWHTQIKDNQDNFIYINDDQATYELFSRIANNTRYTNISGNSTGCTIGACTARGWATIKGYNAMVMEMQPFMSYWTTTEMRSEGEGVAMALYSNNQEENSSSSTLWECDFSTDGCGLNEGTVSDGVLNISMGDTMQINASLSQADTYNFSFDIKFTGNMASPHKIYVRENEDGIAGHKWIFEYDSGTGTYTIKPEGDYYPEITGFEKNVWHTISYTHNRTTNTSTINTAKGNIVDENLNYGSYNGDYIRWEIGTLNGSNILYRNMIVTTENGEQGQPVQPNITTTFTFEASREGWSEDGWMWRDGHLYSNGSNQNTWSTAINVTDYMVHTLNMRTMNADYLKIFTGTQAPHNFTGINYYFENQTGGYLHFKHEGGAYNAARNTSGDIIQIPFDTDITITIIVDMVNNRTNATINTSSISGVVANEAVTQTPSEYLALNTVNYVSGEARLYDWTISSTGESVTPPPSGGEILYTYDFIPDRQGWSEDGWLWNVGYLYSADSNQNSWSPDISLSSIDRHRHTFELLTANFSYVKFYLGTQAPYDLNGISYYLERQESGYLHFKHEGGTYSPARLGGEPLDIPIGENITVIIDVDTITGKTNATVISSAGTGTTELETITATLYNRMAVSSILYGSGETRLYSWQVESFEESTTPAGILSFGTPWITWNAGTGYVHKGQFFNYTINITCTGGDCGSPNVILDPQISDSNINSTFENMIYAITTNNVLMIKTLNNGIQVALTPWTTVSHSTDPSVFKDGTHAGCDMPVGVTPTIDYFCYVTDEMSQAFWAVSMSRNATIVNNYALPMLNTMKALNTSQTIQHGSPYDGGWNTKWKGYYNGTHIVTDDDEDSAVDADYRFLFSSWNMYNNPTLTNETLRTAYYNHAIQYCADIRDKALLKETRQSTVAAGRNITYFQTAGIRQTAGGFHQMHNSGVFPGYMFDGVTAMALCYQQTNDTEYLDASRSLTEQYLNVINWTSTTGFRGHAGRVGKYLSTNTTHAIFEAIETSDLYMDNADAVRFSAVGLAMYYQRNTGVVLNDKLTEYYSEYIGQSGYAPPDYHARYYINGTPFFENNMKDFYGYRGLGMQGSMGRENNIDTLSFANALRDNYDHANNRFYGTDDLGIYWGGFAINSFGFALGNMDASLLGDSNYTPPVSNKNGDISTTPGDTPFYTIDSQPHDSICLISMTNGTTCEITWRINATGEVDVNYTFFAYVQNTNIISDEDNVMITLSNNPPTMNYVNITPTPAYTASTLTMSVNAADIDGDTITYEYRWYKNGAIISGQTSTTLASNQFVKNDAIIASARAFDGTEYSDWLNSSSLTISNTAPIASSVVINPTSAYTDTDLQGSYTYFDADGDSNQSTFRWFKNGAVIAGQTTTSLSSSNFVKGDIIIFEVTPNDGTTAGTPLNSSGKTILNTAPTMTYVNILPSGTAYTDTTLTANVSGADIDSDSLTYQYIWYKNGVAISGQTSSTLASSQFVKNDIIILSSRTYDGTAYSSYMNSSSKTIANSIPTASGVAISPSFPTTTDNLVGSYTFTDIDGDDDSSTYKWYKNGVLISGQTTSNLPSSNFIKGDIIIFEVTPNDGTISGTSVNSSSITIINTAPSATDPNITPQPAYTYNNLLGTYTFVDADGDSDDSTYSWYKNGMLLAGQTGTTLLSSNFVKGDVIVFEVRPFDGAVFGTRINSSSITIQNTPPEIIDIIILPSSPTTSDDINISYTFVDADSDNDYSLINWYVNGIFVVDSTTTLLSAEHSDGDNITIQLIPYDGEDYGTEQNYSVQIGNTAPVVSSAVITPTTAYTNTTLTGTYDYFDVDDDPDSSTYQWLKNGVVINGQTTSTLSGAYFNKGDAITFRVTAYDGKSTGNTITSDAITILNTLPVVSNATILQEEIYTDTTVSGSYTYYDEDGDTNTSMITWFVNNISVSNNQTLSSSLFVKGQTIIMQVTAYDGEEYGNSINSSGVIVLNTAPSVSDLNITPLEPYTTSNLTGNYIFIDIDYDPDLSYEMWYKNNTLIYEGGILPSSYFVKEDEIYFVVIPFDGEQNGTMQNTSIVILNSAPVLVTDNINISSNTIEGTILAIMNGTDADGDVLTYNLVFDELGKLLLNSSTGILTLSETLSNDWVGTYLTTISVNDGEYTTTDSFSLTITGIEEVTLPIGGGGGGTPAIPDNQTIIDDTITHPDFSLQELLLDILRKPLKYPLISGILLLSLIIILSKAYGTIRSTPKSRTRW
jgi:hypothetical protein